MRKIFVPLLLFAFALQAEELTSSLESYLYVAKGCEVAFPEPPHHLANQIADREGGESVEYHIYLSNSKEKEGIYLLVVAEYPYSIPKEQELQALEGFLSGLLFHDGEKELISTELVEFSGHRALDFFVRQEERLFRGRALVVENHLYLLALESTAERFPEKAFEKFVHSFHLQEKLK